MLFTFSFYLSLSAPAFIKPNFYSTGLSTRRHEIIQLKTSKNNFKEPKNFLFGLPKKGALDDDKYLSTKDTAEGRRREETRGQSEHEKSRGAGMRTKNPNF
jgi:hypothetical protein